MRRIIFLLLFCLPVLLCFGQTQSELDEIATNDYHKAETELNSVYQQILQEYKGDTSFIENLKTAERLWLQFRHAEMRVKFPMGKEYGSIFPMCWAEYLAELTKNRTKELRVWLDRINDGEGCPGSVKIR